MKWGDDYLIRRPMVWILVAYMAGMFLASQRISVVIIVAVFLLYYLSCYVLMYRVKNQFINSKDQFLWGLPLLLLLGLWSMSGHLKKPELYGAFDQEITCELTGQITMVVEKQSGRALYVKNNRVLLPDGNEYLCENVIVSIYDKKTQYNADKYSDRNINSNTDRGTDIESDSTDINSDSSRDNNIANRITYLNNTSDIKDEEKSKNSRNSRNSNYGNNVSYRYKDNSLNNSSNLSNNIKTSDASYLVGNKITVQGTLHKFTKANNPGQFDEQLYYQIENIDFKLIADEITIIDSRYSIFHIILSKLKSRLMKVYSSMLPEKESGALIAMLLGDKYLLDNEIKELYQENGISHILAISGLHITLIGMSVFYLLKKLKLPILFAGFASILFIYSYGILTNFSVSTNRAVVMMIVMLLSTLLGKTYDMLSATALSALIILLQNPLQIYSAGFLLSFGAVLGIACILPCLNHLFPSKNSLTGSLKLSLSAQIATAPFICYFFYQLPTYSILTNLIILPFVTILTLSSILAGLAGLISMSLGIFLIGGANYILKFYEWLCKLGSRLPGNLITVGRPEPMRLLLYVLFLITFLWVVKRYHKKYSLVLLIGAFIILILPQKIRGLEVTMLDVGQGSSIYMESRSGTGYLIDGGSSDVKKVGTYRITPFLLSSGVDSIDYVIMTHSDSDHINGISELITEGKIAIRYLLMPDIGNKDEAYLELETLAKEHDISVKYIKAGDMIQDGKLNILCLHPVQNYIPVSTNSYSTVLSVRYGEFDMLLTGDLEADGEEQLLKRPEGQSSSQSTADQEGKSLGQGRSGYNGVCNGEVALLDDYDVLQVAHHGSKSSTSEEFLALIKPELSLISCGKNNRYGHPNEELLERLRQAENDIKITYQSGAITLLIDGKRMQIKEYQAGFNQRIYMNWYK